MLAIENSYRATTKLISTVDAMFQSLLQAVG
jgi:flagellar hook-associated protein FlgK